MGELDRCDIVEGIVEGIVVGGFSKKDVVVDLESSKREAARKRNGTLMINETILREVARLSRSRRLAFRSEGVAKVNKTYYR